MKKIIAAIMIVIGSLSYGGTMIHSAVTQEVVTTPEVTATATHGGIVLSTDSQTPQHVTIYALTGQQVKSLDIVNGEMTVVELPSGYYIVKTASRSVRVLVR